MPLKPGDRIERYVIEAALGSGGMGEVYRARDARLQRSVALKILHAQRDKPGTNPSAGAARMLREARAAAALEHPNVVAIYDVGEVETPEELEGTTYLAMELIKGKTLRAYVGDARVPVGERIRWLTDVARGLAAAHAAGLVHRDIKPENVMVREDGVVKVLDFGIAKRAVNTPVDPTSSTEGYALPTMTGQGVVVGTPLYMAPEQLRADTVDFRADQFAWGVVAYELLTGKLPWNAEAGGIALVAQIVSATPPSLAERPDVPAHVAAVVTRAMAKDREARFATMDQLVGSLDALDVTLPRRPVSSIAPESLGLPPAPPAPFPDTVRSRPPPPRRSRRAMALAGAVAVALLVAGATILARYWTKAPPAAARTLAPTPACTSNAECTKKLGADAVCHRDDGACAALASEDCQVLAEPRDLARDDTVFFGMLMPRSGPKAGFGAMEVHGADLARRDFAQTVGATAQLDAPPLAILACDDAADPLRAARHLALDVRVPAVIGFNGADAMEVGTSILLPHGVLTIVAPNAASLLMNVRPAAGEPRLLWRTSFNYADTARSVSAVVHDVLEKRLRAGRLVGGANPMRVALVRWRNSQTAGFAKRLFETLSYNGMSALENGGSYREIVYDDSPDASDTFAPLVSELDAFAPHVVVYDGSEPSVRGMIGPLEARWSAARPYRPFYIAPEHIPDAALGFIGNSADRRARFLGLVAPSTTPENAQFVMHYNETYPDKVTRIVDPTETYDAFYLLGYATYALGEAPVTGKSLAAALPKLLPPGKPVSVGPADILDTFGVLRAGGKIDLVGSGGSLDLDPVTGDQQLDMTLVCPSVDARGFAAGNMESGLLYDARTARLRGEVHCP